MGGISPVPPFLDTVLVIIIIIIIIILIIVEIPQKKVFTLYYRVYVDNLDNVGVRNVITSITLQR